MSLELADEPCLVVLEATRLIARLPVPDGPPAGEYGAHDCLVATLPTRTRQDFGVLTDTGRVLRVPAVDLPALPATTAHPSLVGASPVTAFAQLEPGERVVGLVPFEGGFALGTAVGTVKRVAAGGRQQPRRVVGDHAEGRRCRDRRCDLRRRDELTFVSSAASLLRFPASAVRPQGRSAAGMAGIDCRPMRERSTSQSWPRTTRSSRSPAIPPAHRRRPRSRR